METQKTPNSQSNLQKEITELEESGSLTSDYTPKLESSIQYGAHKQKKKYRSVEQDRKIRDKLTYLWSPNL